MVKFSLVKRCLTLWVVALAILLALIPQQVHACSCVVPGPPAEELAQASAVFAGKVVNLEFPSSSGSSNDPVQVTFDVSQVWKGPAFQTLIVHTVADGASCGYGFQVEQEYLVYIYGEEDHLQASLCSRTQPLADAVEDLSALGAGAIPTKENPALLPQPVSPLSPVSPLGPVSPLSAGGNPSLPACMLPLALVGMLGILPISARMRMARRQPQRPSSQQGR